MSDPEALLRNLLAVIHRDGGHRTEAVGLDQSHAEAMALSSERIAVTVDLEALGAAGRFTAWTTSDMAGQCRMQAADAIDTEYSQFMRTVADRLKALAPSSDLTARCADVLEWRGSGIIGPGALRTFAETLPDDITLPAIRRAEDETIREALRFIAAAGRPSTVTAGA